jgi:TolA-binding protein
MTSCVQTKDKLKKEIEAKEASLFAAKDGQINSKLARETIMQYRYYAEKFPEDTLSAEYLFKAGDVSSGIGAYDNALEYFHIVSAKYPQSSKAAYSLFLQGFIYENSLNDTAKARKFYTEFIDRYPNHEMSESARFSIAHLGKSADEVIEHFNANSPDSTTTPQ